MKLKDEQGNEYEFKNELELRQAGVTTYMLGVINGYLAPINPMPELEVGDWFQSNSMGINVWINSPMGIAELELGRITEIRKANGVTWRK